MTKDNPDMTQHVNFTDIKQKETTFNQDLFNIEKTDYYSPKLFSGQARGVFNTLTTAHPRIERLFKKQKSQDWDEQETLENNDAKILFQTMNSDLVEPMIRTLGFQWETDTVAGRTIAIFASFAATYDQLFEIYMRIADNENLHARTYSEIIKMSFDDPEKVLTKILSARQSLQRLSKAGEVFSKTINLLCEVRLGIKQKDENYYKQLYLFIVTLYCVERIQFLSSFAITFCYGDNGLFMEIANSVKLICRDEYEIHCRLGKYLLKSFAEDADSLEGKMLASSEVKNIIDEVYNAEINSLEYQLETVKDNGLFGFSIEDFKSWVNYCSAEVYKDLGVEPPFKISDTHKLKYMDDWVVNDNFQQAPQEEDVTNYIFGTMLRDDKGKEYKTNF